MLEQRAHEVPLVTEKPLVVSSRDINKVCNLGPVDRVGEHDLSVQISPNRLKFLSRGCCIPGGSSILGGRGGLAPKFASEILVGAPNFASKNVSDKIPQILPSEFQI